MGDKKETTALAKTDDSKPALVPILHKSRDALEDFLPAHVDADKFFRVANAVLKSNSSLAGCLNSKKGQAGFIESMKLAAMDGLYPDGKREAAIIPYGGVPTYVRMYGGMVKMMRQSGEVLDIQTGLVCENDEFEFERGTSPFVKHKQALSNRGKKSGAWCVIKTKGGGIYFDVMGSDEIIQIKNAAKAKAGPWGNSAHEGEMWRKTVLRRAAKLAPLSTDLHEAFAHDDSDYDYSQYQEPTAADRLKKDMAKKIEGKDAPLIEGDVKEKPSDKKPKADGYEKITLPDDPEKMTGQQWEDYTTALITEYKKLNVPDATFDEIYGAELGLIADKSSADYNRILDAQDAGNDDEA